MLNTPMNHFINSMSSYDSNIMLAAVISLLVVILFVLLLHIYAKWFLDQARHRRRSSSVSVSHVLRPSRFHSFTLDPFSSGLAPSIISSIPLFVYRAQEHEQCLECVICLSVFEENEIGRSLIKCGHDFHVECIDMWLISHSSCPICRAPAVVGDTANEAKCMEPVEAGLDSEESRVEIGIDVSNSENENGNGNNNIQVNYDSPSSSSSSSSLGCSLKRMLSRNRSERKVFSSCNNDSEISV